MFLFLLRFLELGVKKQYCKFIDLSMYAVQAAFA